MCARNQISNSLFFSFFLCRCLCLSPSLSNPPLSLDCSEMELGGAGRVTFFFRAGYKSPPGGEYVCVPIYRAGENITFRRSWAVSGAGCSSNRLVVSGKFYLGSKADFIYSGTASSPSSFSRFLPFLSLSGPPTFLFRAYLPSVPPPPRTLLIS